MPQVTISQAALLVGLTRQGVNKLTKNGDLSFSYNAEKTKVIDISELQRVFPNMRKFEDLEKIETASHSPAPGADAGGAGAAILKIQLQAAERERDMVIAERERERRQLQERIENLETSLASSQEQSKALLRLTDQSAAKPQASEEQARMNRELTDTVKRLERQVRRMQIEQEQQKNSGFFRRWRGGGQTASGKPASARSESKPV